VTPARGRRLLRIRPTALPVYRGISGQKRWKVFHVTGTGGYPLANGNSVRRGAISSSMRRKSRLFSRARVLLSSMGFMIERRRKNERHGHIRFVLLAMRPYQRWARTIVMQ